MKDNKPTLRDFVIIGVLLILVLVALCAEIGCGNSATVKPSNETANNLKTSLKNQQEMRENIDQLNGQLTKIQQSFSEVINTITTTISQRFDTFQESVANKIGEVGRDVNTKTSKSTNTATYGISLVAVVLLFVLAAIWLLARVFREAVIKILK